MKGDVKEQGTILSYKDQHLLNLTFKDSCKKYLFIKVVSVLETTHCT